MKQHAETFWNFRRSFKAAKVLDVGSHLWLVRKRDSRFILIDSYKVSGRDHEGLLALTDNGATIDTIINVKPFHALHCTPAQEIAPYVRLQGTQRHREQLLELPWEREVIEDAAPQAQFDDLDMSVPAALGLVPPDDSAHASSVLVRHRANSIVYVDETLMVLAAPGTLCRRLPQSRLAFHLISAKALQHHAGAAGDFTTWAQKLAHDWATTPIVRAAHSAVRKFEPGRWHNRLTHALPAVRKTLDQHRTHFGRCERRSPLYRKDLVHE